MHARWFPPVVALLLLCGGGCAAYQASQQPSKKNLALCQQGVPRANLIAEFGPPLYTEELSDGTLTDIFHFRQGYSRGAKASRALVHGVGDVLTGGLWEVLGIPIETLASGSDVKLEIGYDANRNVQWINVIQGDKIIARR